MSLAEAIRAAVGGRKTRAAARLEDERPEDIEDDENPEAEGDEPDPDAEGHDRDPDAEDDKPDEANEDEDAEEKTPEARKAHARGRRAERRRMAAILGSPSAEANAALAAHLAFSTSMKAADVLKALAASGGTGAGKLAGRMAAARQPRLGGGGAAPDARAATVAGVKAAVQALHKRR